MRAYAIFFTLLFNAFSDYSFSQKKITYKDSIRFEYTLVNGARDGAFKSYYPNDSVCETGQFVMGSRDGLWTKRYKSGLIDMKNTYKDDYVFYSEGFGRNYIDGKQYKFREIHFKEGLYKTDFESLLTLIDSFIARNNRHISEKASEHLAKYGRVSFYSRFDVPKWGNQVDSTIVTWIGSSTDNVIIRRFDRKEQVIDSIVFQNKMEIYRDTRSYYTREDHKLFEKSIYLNSILIKKIEYLYSNEHYKLSLYKDGRLESSGLIKNGKKKGKWEFFDVNGNITKVLDY